MRASGGATEEGEPTGLTGARGHEGVWQSPEQQWGEVKGLERGLDLGNSSQFLMVTLGLLFLVYSNYLMHIY